MGWFNKLLGRDSHAPRLAIIDVSDKTFELQVIRRSYKEPVLVDFWASWCGPCRQLGPMLERQAEDPQYKFKLAKLNTEHNQKMAKKYGIYSIPNVKAFRNGQVIDEFSGAIPEVLVKRFIKKVEEAEPPPPRIAGSGNPAQRLKQAEQHLRKGRGFQAFVLLNEFPESPESERVADLLPLATFLMDMADGDGLTGLDELDTEYEAAAAALKKRNYDRALKKLSEALDAGEDMDREYTQEVMASIQAFLG